MEEQPNTTNSLQLVGKNMVCSWILNWVVDPFGSVLSKLKNDESYVLEKEIPCTFWQDDWQIKLNFICNQGASGTYGPEITLINLNKTDSEIAKAAYKFRISVFTSSSQKLAIYNGSSLNSAYQDRGQINWSNYEPLKLEIVIEYFPLQSVSKFNPIAFGLHERLAAHKDENALVDFMICVDGQKLKANKTILALVSPVFLAMFSHDFKEKRKQILHIDDTDADTVQKFLDFAYTGESPKFESMVSAIRVFHMAEKYQVPALKNMCVSFIHSAIANKVELNNILELLRHKVI